MHVNKHSLAAPLTIPLDEELELFRKKARFPVLDLILAVVLSGLLYVITAYSPDLVRYSAILGMSALGFGGWLFLQSYARCRWAKTLLGLTPPHPVIALDGTGMTLPLFLLAEDDPNRRYFSRLGTGFVQIQWDAITACALLYPRRYNTTAVAHYQLTLKPEVAAISCLCILCSIWQFAPEKQTLLWEYVRRHTNPGVFSGN